mmetsp:Transcript_3745/g.4325  ORF Transcript_3745/g.4325 Transcript_3745/m.4325 type:complete len:299 (-) Transcript_3745:83-979(-)
MLYEVASSLWKIMKVRRQAKSEGRRRASLIGIGFSSLFTTGLALSAPFLDPRFRETELSYLPSAAERMLWKDQKAWRTTEFESYVPYSTGHLCHVSKVPALSSEECDLLVEEVKEQPMAIYADELLPDGTFTSPRAQFITNVGYCLCEDRGLGLLRKAWYQRILPLLMIQFEHYFPPSADLRIAYAVVNSYDAEHPFGKRDLFTHNEPMVISFAIPLVAREMYSGGGTYIKAIDKTFALDKGFLISHASAIQHGATAITKGHRTVLVGFCILDDKHDAWSQEFFNAISNAEIETSFGD